MPEMLLVRMPAETKAALKMVAGLHDRSMSGEMRQALDAWLDRHTVPVGSGEPPRRPSFGDVEFRRSLPSAAEASARRSSLTRATVEAGAPLGSGEAS